VREAKCRLRVRLIDPFARRMPAEVELSVETRDRLVGDEEEGRAGLGDVRLFEPYRMARTVGIAVACDLLREDLDASARRSQRMSNRVLAETTKRAAVVCLLRHGQAQNPSKVGAARPCAARLVPYWSTKPFENRDAQTDPIAEPRD
jgi:hypothetical protein